MLLDAGHLKELRQEAPVTVEVRVPGRGDTKLDDRVNPGRVWWKQRLPEFSATAVKIKPEDVGGYLTAPEQPQRPSVGAPRDRTVARLRTPHDA